MAFVKISNKAGTKETMTLPIIIVGNKSVELTDKVMSLLSIGDKDRIVGIMDDENNTVYLGKSNSEKEGHSVSVGGKFQANMIKSWLSDIANEEGQVLLSNDSVTFEGVTYYRVDVYNSPSTKKELVNDNNEERAQIEEIAVEDEVSANNSVEEEITSEEVAIEDEEIPEV